MQKEIIKSIKLFKHFINIMSIKCSIRNLLQGYENKNNKKNINFKTIYFLDKKNF
jgi:hypothetical protein